MMKAAYFGNPWIGMFAKSNNSHTLVPVDAVDKFVDSLVEGLKTEPVRMLVGNSNLLGLYVAMNSKGAVLPNVASEEDVSRVKGLGLNVYRSGGAYNAYGNNIAVNDKGGVVNPAVPPEERKKMEDVLGVELVEASISRYNTVGSCALATNRGFITHFSASEAEIELLGKAFGVPGSKGSINTGTGFVSLGIVANDKGYVVGEATTAFEMGRIEEALGFL